MLVLRSTCLCLDLHAYVQIYVSLGPVLCLCLDPFVYVLCAMFVVTSPISLKKKKRGKGSDCFWFPRAPHLTPLPTTHFHPPLFYLLADSLFSFFHFLSLLFTYTHTHTHFHTHPLASTPNHTISPSFFRQDHRKNTQEPQSIFIIFF